LADEISNFSNEISDMRDIQRKVVENYREEIEELRKQRNMMLNNKPKSDYLALNQEFEDFNEGKFLFLHKINDVGVEKLRNILKKQVDDIKLEKPLSVSDSKKEDIQINLINKEFDDLKAKIQEDMLKCNNEYNQGIDYINKAVTRSKARYFYI